jgi:regulatory protein
MSWLFIFMKTITDLVVQKRDKDRVSIFLDGEFAFGLAASVAAGLKVGQQLSPDDIEDLKRKEQTEKAKKSAFRFISYRPRSVYEVQSNLQRKKFDEETVDLVVEYLINLDLLDDAAFARYWVEQRETFRPRSRFALSQELSQKGINRKIIEEVLEEVDERAAALRAVDKQAHRWTGLPEDAYKEKMAGFLQRRGFPYEIIREILEESWQD